jgi:hypothetical protein
MNHNISRRTVLAAVSAAAAKAIPSLAAFQPGYAHSPAQDLEPHLGPPPDRMSHKRQRALLKENLEKMRKDAAEMASLAASIQEDLEQTTENELPLRVVSKAEKVEKLAKKIKNTAKGF